MNFIDLVLGAIILYGIVKGFLNGLFIEVASLLALIAGGFGAIHFSYIVGDHLNERLQWDESYVNLAAFAITFIAIIIAISLLGKLLTKLADMAALGFVNKVMGSIFGGLKFVIIIGALLIFVSRLNLEKTLWENSPAGESLLYKPVKDLGGLIFDHILKDETPTIEVPTAMAEDS